MELSKKSSVILWSCVAAAVGGAATILAVATWRRRADNDLVVKSHLRNIHEVLADCYDKIDEIERHIPDMTSIAPAPSKQSFRVHSNGKPAMES